MILREYQEVAVNDASDALDKHGNTLVVAPTGAGKTIMLSALVGKRYKSSQNVLVLQHRDELVDQDLAWHVLAAQDPAGDPVTQPLSTSGAVRWMHVDFFVDVLGVRFGHGAANAIHS